MQDLNIVIVQAHLEWENVDANLTYFSNRLIDIKTDTNLVLLPEMFNTGFSMNTKHCSEEMSGPTVLWMLEQANKYNVFLGGSLIIKDGDSYYNRFVIVSADGDVQFYNKRHLFRMAGEDQYFTGGNQRTIIEINHWKLNLQVCYDLRFPVWSRNRNAFDALIYIANWPKIRANHWETLLKARAIENQCYVLAVNRIGEDGNGIMYNGLSGAIDYQGNWMARLEDAEQNVEVSLNHELLSVWREKFPVHLDADDFHISGTD